MSSPCRLSMLKPISAVEIKHDGDILVKDKRGDHNKHQKKGDSMRRRSYTHGDSSGDDGDGDGDGDDDDDDDDDGSLEYKHTLEVNEKFMPSMLMSQHNRTKGKSRRGIDDRTPEEKLEVMAIALNEFMVERRYDEAVRLLLAIATLSRIAYGENSWQRVQAILNVARAYLDNLLLPVQGLASAVTARDIWESMSEEERQNYIDGECDMAAEIAGDVYMIIGICLGQTGKPKAAVQSLKKTISFVNDIVDDDRRLAITSRAYLEIARIYRRTSKSELALHALENASSIAVECGSTRELAAVCLEFGQLKEEISETELAVEMYTKAGKLYKKLHKSNSDDRISRMEELDAAQALGFLLVKQEEDETAEKPLRLAAALCRLELGQENSRTIEVEEELCRLLLRLGSLDDAAKICRSVIDAKSIALGEHNVSIGNTYKLFGTIRLEQNKKMLAHKHYTRAHLLFKNHYGERHDKTSKIQAILDTIIRHKKNSNIPHTITAEGVQSGGQSIDGDDSRDDSNDWRDSEYDFD